MPSKSYSALLVFLLRSDQMVLMRKRLHPLAGTYHQRLKCRQFSQNLYSCFFNPKSTFSLYRHFSSYKLSTHNIVSIQTPPRPRPLPPLPLPNPPLPRPRPRPLPPRPRPRPPPLPLPTPLPLCPPAVV